MNRRLMWFAVFVSLATYYALFVWRLSFVILGTRYYLPADDVMITMCYGRTLAQTGILAWYPGGPGGGVSTVVWAWLCSLLWRIWSDPSKTALLLQSLNGILWLMTAAFVYLTARRHNLRAGFVALTLFASCWPVTNLFVQGWEFSVVMLGLVMAYYFVIRRKLWGVVAGLLVAVLTRISVPGNTPAVLKLTGYPWPLMVTRAAWMEAVSLLQYGFPILLLAFLGCYYFRRWWVALAFGIALLFSLAVGGDAWYELMHGSRWVICTLPLVAIMAAQMLDALASWVGRRSCWVLLAGTIALCLTWTAPTQTLLLDKPLMYVEKTQHWSAVGLLLRDSTAAGTMIALPGAGTIPWLAPGKRYCDLLGFNDRHIAGLPAHRAPSGKNALTYFFPGHLKFDPHWTLATYQPSVVTQVWAAGDFPSDWFDLARDYVPVNVTYAGYTSIIFVYKGRATGK